MSPTTASNSHNTRILVADDDSVTRTLLVDTLRERGYTVLAAADGATAWRLASGSAPPRILLLDWMMPQMSGLEVCRRVRAMPGRSHVHVLLMTARNRHTDMLEGFAAGADDFLTKPLASAEVLARVQAAERTLALANAPAALTDALHEAATSPGGDVMVRAGGEVGRIMFHGGRVAWAHLSSEPSSLHDLLRDVPGISREDVAAVIEECFVAGRHFTEVLIEWEIVGPEELETRLRAWLSAKLRAILTRPFDLVMFVPQQRRYNAIAFPLADLVPAPLLAPEEPPPELEPPPALPPESALLTCLDEMMAISGAQAAAVLDSERGAFMARRGLPVPASHLERDWTQPYAESDAVEQAWLVVYRAPEKHWDLYQLGEELTDLEDAFRLWRFRHVTTVERVIGFKRGTGGTGGVSYLRKMLDVVLFPEIWKLRTDL